MRTTRLLALVLACMLAILNPMTVFAENVPMTVSGNETVSAEETGEEEPEEETEEDVEETEEELEEDSEEEISEEEKENGQEEISDNKTEEEKSDEPGIENSETGETEAGEVTEEAKEAVSDNSTSSEQNRQPNREQEAQAASTTESEYFPAETWKYGVAEKLEGKGTKENPFLIENASQLALFAKYLNEGEYTYSYYKLTSSIKLNNDLDNPTNIWPGTRYKLYGGFDGNGHTIENLYMQSDSVRDISFIYSAETIENLTINGIKIEYTGTDVPWVSGLVQDAYNVSNCHIKGKFIVTRTNAGTVYAGGLAGNCYGEVTNCSSSAVFQFENASQISVGGLACYNRSTISNCWFDGSLELDTSGKNNSKYFNCGGIVYNNESEGSIENCFTKEEAKISSYNVGGIAYTSYGTITSCTNNATVTGNSATAGIVCTVWSGTVSNCVNQGQLNCTYTSGSADANVSGIASKLSTSGEIQVIGCVNKSDITGTMGDGTSKIIYVSGIAYMVNQSGGTITIQNCINEGKLEGKTIAGILCRNTIKSGSCTIYGCSNEGELVSTYVVGGIIADAGYSNYKSAIKIQQCGNGGLIQGKAASYVGGIAGKVSLANIDSCFNVGTIQAKSLGGIVGSAGNYSEGVPEPQITNCYNLGPLFGESIGGIIGSLQTGYVSSCYNMGKLTQSEGSGYSSAIGGIVNKISTYINNVTVQDCFNCGVIEVDNISSDIGGIASYISNSKENLTVKVSNCYSIGTIKLPEGAKAEDCYSVTDGIAYLSGSDATMELENIYFIDSDLPDYGGYITNLSVDGLHPCTEDELKQVSTYSGFDFTDTWKKGGRKYPFPILRGVGEEYLEYNFAGVGEETVFSQYIIQVVEKSDKNTYYSKGIPNVVVSFRDNTYVTDKNGMICFLTADKELGEVVITHKDFYEEKATVTLENGKVYIMEMERKIDIKPPKLNVSASVDLEGGQVESDDVSFSAIDFPFDMEISTSFSRKGEDNVESIPFQVEIDREKQEIKMSFGMKFKNSDEPEEEGAEYYKLTKEAMSKCLNAKSKDDVINILRKNGAKTTTKEWGGSTDFYYMGYLTLYWTGETYAVKESQGLIGFSGSSEFTYRPASTGGIAYGKIELKLSADGKYTLEFDENLQKIASKIGLDLKQALTLAAGVGCEMAKIEVGATGEFKETFEFDGVFMVDEDLTVEFNANPYVEGKLWVFGVKRELKLWNGAQLWPELKLNEPTRNRVATIQEFGDAASYEMMGREYLNRNISPVRVMSGDSNIPMAINNNLGAQVLHQDSVYPDAKTSLCELTDGTKIATWIADAGTDRSDADRTILCYSVADEEGNFGEARAVWDTGRGDYYPVLLAKGNSAYVAWVNADKQYGDSQVTVEDLSENNSIYVSVFDRSSNSFGEPVRITKNRGKMPLYLKLASDGKEVTVTWVENSENSTFMSKGANAIYSRVLKAGTLGNTESLVEGLDYLYDMDTNYINGAYALVWNQDMDGDLTTNTDTEVFCLQNDNKTQLTSNGQMESTLVLTGKDLYFIKEGMICRIPNLDKNLAENTGIVCSSDFKVLEGKLGTALLWYAKDGFVTVPMVSYEKGNVFTDAVVLKELGDISVTSCGAVYEDDGTITLFAEQCAADNEWTMNWNEPTTNQSPFGDTNLRYYTGMIPADLVVNDYLYYDQELAIPGEQVTFETEVYNNSDREIKEVTLSLKKDGSEVAKTGLAVNLSAGASTEVEMPYTIPADFTAGTYTLTVTTGELNENNLTNNSASAEAGYANLVLKDMQVVKNEDGSATITGTLKNEGYRSVSGVTLKTQLLNVKEEAAEGGLAARTELAEETGISLDVGEARAIQVAVSAEQIVFENAYDSKVFYVSANSEANEILYTDNEETLLLHPARAESMELGEDITLTQGATKQLTPVIAPTGAYAECIYTSSDLTVAMVGEDGSITALGEGSATIMAVTADGMASDTITVTVEAGVNAEEATVEYSLDSQTLTLELGEEADLSLLWEDMTADGTGVPERQNINWICSDLSTVKLVSAQPSGGEMTETGDTLATATLTGLKAGDAVITVTIDNSVILSCVVQVTDNRVRTASFDISEAQLEKGESLQLSLSTNPAGGNTDEFTFSSSDEEVAAVDEDGFVTALKAGEATIQAVYKNTPEGEEAVKAFCQISVTDMTQEKYSLSFDSNGGSNIPEEKASQFVVYGGTFVFPEEVTRPGYYFVGWNTKIDGSGVSFSGSETIVAGSLEDGTVLYAQWVEQAAGMWVADIEEQVYTGSAIKPEVAVYDGTKLLKEGVDYSLTYKNNVQPQNAFAGSKAPTVTIKGRGNYTGSQTVTFTILPIDFASAEGLAAEDVAVKANGKVQKPVPKVTWNGESLIHNTDFTLEYPDTGANAYKAVGEYTIRIVGKGGYTGVREVTLIITNNQLMSEVSVSPIGNQKYTSEPVKPAITVTHGNKILTEKIGDGVGDYTVTYKNNVKVGTATVSITGTGTDADGDGISYSGTKNVTFRIVGVSLSKAKVENIPSAVEYNGQEVTAADFAVRPALKVSVEGVTTSLTEGKDYVISYTKNDDVGTASIIFSGINGYTGSIKRNFRITPYDLEADNGEKVEVYVAGSVPYAKGGSKPEPVVTFDGKTLKPRVDYTVSYQNVSKVHDGTGNRIPTVIIKGKGCYTGSIEKTFAIEKQDISKLSMAAEDKVYRNAKNAYKTTVSITDVNGKELKAGIDYNRTYSYSYAEDTVLGDGTLKNANDEVGKTDIVPVGTKLYVRVAGKGYYEGEIRDRYRIIQADIAKATVKVPNQTYTGKALCPGKEVITVKYDNTVLTAEDYDIIGYSNNIDKGTAKLIIQGKGNYGGTKTVSFKIKAKTISWWWNNLLTIGDKEEKAVDRVREENQVVEVEVVPIVNQKDAIRESVPEVSYTSEVWEIDPEVKREISVKKELRMFDVYNPNRQLFCRMEIM